MELGDVLQRLALEPGIGERGDTHIAHAILDEPAPLGFPLRCLLIRTRSIDHNTAPVGRLEGESHGKQETRVTIAREDVPGISAVEAVMYARFSRKNASKARPSIVRTTLPTASPST